MDFEFNEDQEMMRDMAARVFSDMATDDVVKGLSKERHATQMHTALWQQLAELGILGIPFAEDSGGMGMSLMELCLVLEQQGRTVAPVPLLSTVVEAGMTIEAGSNAELAAALIPQLVAGQLVLSPVGAYAGIQSTDALKAQRSGQQWELSGRSSFGAYASLAHGFLVSLVDSEGEALIAYVAKDTAGVSVVNQIAINDEPAGFAVFDQLAVSAQSVVAHGAHATQLMAAQQRRAWVAQAALQVGLLDEGLKRAAEYVSERKQFGRALGSFQAVSQQAANAYMQNEALRSVYWRALDDIEQNEDYALSAHAAKYWVGMAGHSSAHTFLHIHGGIGQDLDYPIHRYFLWAKQNERYLGSPDKTAAQAGELLLSRLDDFLGVA